MKILFWITRYFGGIKRVLADHECGTKTPALFQVIVRLPFRYGKSRFETLDSWIDVRVSAFTSAAWFLDEQAVLKVGDPVSGFLEGSNSKEHFGSQLTGWDKCSAADWQLLDSASLPPKIELNSDVLSALPQLHRDGFPIVHSPNVTYGLFTAPEVPKYQFDARQAQMTANTMARNRRSQDPNPPPPSANSIERRLHQRWLERQNDAGFQRGRGGGRSALKCLKLKKNFSIYTSPLLSRR